MSLNDTFKVGYVLKRYPRYSETFVVSEILAHEAAGLAIEIFALRPPVDAYFQNIISEVRAPVKYLLSHDLRGSTLWAVLEQASAVLPDLWSKLAIARGEDVHDVHQAIMLACEVRTRGIAHLHAHFGTSATTVARLASHFAEIPYTFTAHAKDIFHESVQPDDVERKLSDAAAVVTISDYNLNYLNETYGQAAAKVQRIYNGLDLNQFTYASPQNRPLRIIAIGRLIEKKGFTYLIEACDLLRSRGYEFECHIVGAGDLRDNLSAQIEALNLQSYVELIGPRPQSEIIDIVQSAAVLAAPCVVGTDSNRDGIPTVLLEAMALGTPCVSTDVTGIPEILRHQETGLMVPQHDAIALSKALEKLLTDAQLRVQLATQARQLIEANFDIHCNAAHLRTIFRAAPVAAVQEVR
ncbi:glycosyltransferase [Gloeocapsopsis sp. IPPAS B-1203]|uniref:glycosyltransferase n=1 Tax=Gloeocapsopsis sp. IPPAS B-1203 TaxID=2049454 RepID=UPI000C1A7F39|nr:glycosyltransferase [Gloeocapsopsis sp. IPPAS B-1203]PIG93631.1 colanic acid biosynthesis glycosyltransferase WcaL [Gloeocapsopsis sp. IPPAS B-1203]